MRSHAAAVSDPTPEEFITLIAVMRRDALIGGRRMQLALLKHLGEVKLSGKPPYHFEKTLAMDCYTKAVRDTGAGVRDEKSFDAGLNAAGSGESSTVPAGMDAFAFKAGFKAGKAERRAAERWEDHPAKPLIAALRNTLDKDYNEPYVSSLPKEEQPAFTMKIAKSPSCEPIFTRRPPQLTIVQAPASPDSVQPVPAATDEKAPDPTPELVTLLAPLFAFVDDPTFPRVLAQYLVSQAQQGIYCSDLMTTLTLYSIEPVSKRFPILGDDRNVLLREKSRDLTICEQVRKVCIGDTVKFFVFVSTGASREWKYFHDAAYDFIWPINLPAAATLSGDISELFKIDWIKVNGHLMQPHFLDNSMGAEQFAFEVSIPDMKHGNKRSVDLSYQFHTIMPKEIGHISYATRFVTRNMRVKLVTDMNVTTDQTHNGQASRVRYTYVPAPPGVPEQKISYELELFGWLLPGRSITFSFRDRQR
jgi:hypothetical protein